jgi:hypothetical protein
LIPPVDLVEIATSIVFERNWIVILILYASCRAYYA